MHGTINKKKIWTISIATANDTTFQKNSASDLRWTYKLYIYKSRQSRRTHAYNSHVRENWKQFQMVSVMSRMLHHWQRTTWYSHLYSFAESLQLNKEQCYTRHKFHGHVFFSPLTLQGLVSQDRPIKLQREDEEEEEASLWQT